MPKKKITKKISAKTKTKTISKPLTKAKSLKSKKKKITQVSLKTKQAKTMPKDESLDHKDLNKSAAMRKLIRAGKDKGYLSYDEVNDILPDEMVSSGELEDVITALQNKDIKVVENDEDFEKIALAKGKTIDVIEFVNLSEVDPIYLDNAYYIEPEETGEKAYLVLLDALKQTGKVAVGKIILKEKEHIVLIRPYGNILVLHTLFYSDEIIKPDFPFLLKEHKVSRSEVKLAKELINAMSGTLHLEKFKDEYRERLLELIEAKLKGLVPPIEVQREVKATEELMKSLEESLKVVGKKRHKKKNTGI